VKLHRLFLPCLEEDAIEGNQLSDRDLHGLFMAGRLAEIDLRYFIAIRATRIPYAG
jgi:hypothetical protein